jgi:hypothetical protein
MFRCHFCNIIIQSQLDIYRAQDHNYCSRECRLRFFNRHIEISNKIYQHNGIDDNKEKNKLISIISHNSCHNLQFLSDIDIDSYRVKTTSSKSLCNNYFTTTLSRILYTVNSLWNIYYND